MAITLILFPMSQNYAESVYLNKIPAVEHESLLTKIVDLPENQDYWDEASAIIERLSKLPRSLLQSLKNNHIKIKLFTGSLTDQAEAAHLKGIQPRGYTTKSWDDVPGMGGSKTVLVKIGHSEKGKDHNSINLELHELGHSVDKILLGNISETSDFQDIWMRDVNILFPNQSYFIDYPEEYFAEAFAMYYYSDDSRKDLLVKAPLTYEFIQSIENDGYKGKEN